MSPDASAVLWIITEFINKLGFPMFVAVYLLLRIEPAIRRLTKAVQSLTDVTQIAAQLTRRTHDPHP